MINFSQLDRNFNQFAHGMEAFKDSWEKKITQHAAQARIEEEWRLHIQKVLGCMHIFKATY